MQTTNRYQFDLHYREYRRISLLAWLLGTAFFCCAWLGGLAALLLWPTYTHEFTPYLKWQDALVASCWCVTLVSLGGCVLVLRFVYALRQGYTAGMLTLEDGNRLRGRDLSPKNLISIFWAVSTTFACFAVMLVGLAPAVLIGWTLHLSNPVLVVFSTIIAFLLSLAGLGLSLPFGAFFIIGLVGGFSFGQRVGASQAYTLNTQTSLRLDGSVLTIIHPERPESLFDLQLLTPDNQRQLLTLLRERWVAAERPWNPTLGDEIEEALRHTRHASITN